MGECNCLHADITDWRDHIDYCPKYWEGLAAEQATLLRQCRDTFLTGVLRDREMIDMLDEINGVIGDE